MPVVGVALKAVEARRYQDPQPRQQIRIDHNSNLTLVQPEGEDRMRVDFTYTTSYGALGVVKLEGTLVLQDAKAHDAATKWQENRNLPPVVAQQVHAAIMNACVPEAVGLAKNIRLPPPIPLPQVQIKDAQGSTQAETAPMDSPEIG